MTSRRLSGWTRLWLVTSAVWILWVSIEAVVEDWPPPFEVNDSLVRQLADRRPRGVPDSLVQPGVDPSPAVLDLLQRDWQDRFASVRDSMIRANRREARGKFIREVAVVALGGPLAALALWFTGRWVVAGFRRDPRRL